MSLPQFYVGVSVWLNLYNHIFTAVSEGAGGQLRLWCRLWLFSGQSQELLPALGPAHPCSLGAALMTAPGLMTAQGLSVSEPGLWSVCPALVPPRLCCALPSLPQ